MSSEFVTNLVGWIPELSATIALLLVATVAYWYGRRRSGATLNATVRSRRELRRAQAMARELETISELIRKYLAKHRASLSRFKQDVNRLEDENQDVAMCELFREAEEMQQSTIDFADQIAYAYDQIRQQTDRLMAFTDTRTDPLTGVSNRRVLDDTLTDQLALKVRYDRAFTLAMFDIDDFKRVNDRQGRLCSDQILQDIARLIDENARETDTVVRYGDEEFIVVMPETDLEEASYFANRVREKVQETSAVTISGGVTHVLDGDSVESVIARADEALYEAKTSGRNAIYRHDGEKIESVVQVTLVQPV